MQLNLIAILQVVYEDVQYAYLHHQAKEKIMLTNSKLKRQDPRPWLQY